MSIVLSQKQRESCLKPFDKNLEVFEGTPRSGKTTAGIFRYIRYLLITDDINHLIVAYNQEQAYRLFIDGDGYGLLHMFDGLARIRHDENGAHLEVHTEKGVRKVYYKGGGKSDSHKSIQGMSLGSVVFMEINLLNLSMIQECFRRTFAAKNRYHFADLNPPAPNHPVISSVFDIQDTRITHWDIKDNPIITEERRQEIYETLKKSKYLLNRDWYGKRVMPEGIIYSMFDMEDNQSPTLMGTPYEMFFSADAGQDDATTVSCNIVTKYKGKFRLNRVANYYHSGRETGQIKPMSVYAKEIKEFIRWCTNKYEMRFTEFFVDPSSRSLREELHLVGIDTSGADNNRRDVKGTSKGIEVGIERLQSAMFNKQFILVDTDKYDHYYFIREIGMYVRDESTKKPIDNWNHCADEARYSCNYFYRKYVI